MANTKTSAAVPKPVHNRLSSSPQKRRKLHAACLHIRPPPFSLLPSPFSDEEGDGKDTQNALQNGHQVSQTSFAKLCTPHTCSWPSSLDHNFNICTQRVYLIAAAAFSRSLSLFDSPGSAAAPPPPSLYFSLNAYTGGGAQTVCNVQQQQQRTDKERPWQGIQKERPPSGRKGGHRGARGSESQ